LAAKGGRVISERFGCSSAAPYQIGLGGS